MTNENEHWNIESRNLAVALANEKLQRERERKEKENAICEKVELWTKIKGVEKENEELRERLMEINKQWFGREEGIRRGLLKGMEVDDLMADVKMKAPNTIKEFMEVSGSREGSAGFKKVTIRKGPSEDFTEKTRDLLELVDTQKVSEKSTESMVIFQDTNGGLATKSSNPNNSGRATDDIDEEWDVMMREFDE